MFAAPKRKAVFIVKKWTLLLAGVLTALVLSSCGANTAYPTPYRSDSGSSAPSNTRSAAGDTRNMNDIPSTERITPNEGQNSGTLARNDSF